MPRALIVGGSGQIGLAVAERLAANNWTVTLASRTPPPVPGPWRFHPLDRTSDDSLAHALGQGADLLVDCIAFDVQHARQIIQFQEQIGHVVAISSASVFRDAEGRTLDESRDRGFPSLPVPIQEDNATVAPGPATYSTKKIAMERALLDDCKSDVTVLRPCAIHGPHSKHAREWWFVRRLLDGRKRIPLAYGAKSRFQTTSTEILASTVCLVARERLLGVRNVVDADAPTVADIGRAVMAVMGREADMVGLPDEPFPPSVGASPWSVAKPFVCASSLPAETTYRETVENTVSWLLAQVNNENWREQLPQLAAYPRDLFDYEAEDEFLGRDAGERV